MIGRRDSADIGEDIGMAALTVSGAGRGLLIAYADDLPEDIAINTALAELVPACRRLMTLIGELRMRRTAP